MVIRTQRHFSPSQMTDRRLRLLVTWLTSKVTTLVRGVRNQLLDAFLRMLPIRSCVIVVTTLESRVGCSCLPKVSPGMAKYSRKPLSHPQKH